MLPFRPSVEIAIVHAVTGLSTAALTGTAAHADCIDDAAAHHHVNAHVLRAIGWHESRLDPTALGRNANGSTDLGAFQINSAHLSDLAPYGVSARSLATAASAPMSPRGTTGARSSVSATPGPPSAPITRAHPRAARGTRTGLHRSS
jgi:hypothetical protein